jgi:hypothetical protein
MSGERISRGRLEGIRGRLSERDMGVLEEVARNRFLTSHQIRRYHFSDHATDAAAIRATNRALARLTDLGLIAHLDRRVGGVRAGSGSHVWTLVEAGARLLQSTGEVEGLPARLRVHEPTTGFLEHTLAVAEVCLRLTEADRGAHFSLVELLREPDCWRAHTGGHGDVIHLRPDLSAITATGDYEDHWFLEIDRSTEPPSRVIRKCLGYEAYRQTGAERKRLGVFPGVVWITPDAKRAATLTDHIAKMTGLSRDLYAVVQVDDLTRLIQGGIGSQETGDGA